MSEFARLDWSFVNWQGQRILVPWFGAPRISPSTEDELRVLKARYRAHIWMALAFVPSMAVGVWLGDLEGFSGIMVGISMVFGIYWAIERRQTRLWPMIDGSRFARDRFLLAYLRSRPIGERLKELTWSGLGLLICAPMLVAWSVTAVESVEIAWFPLKLAFVMIGPGLLTFLTVRHAAIVLRSLVPDMRKRSAEGSGHGA